MVVPAIRLIVSATELFAALLSAVRSVHGIPRSVGHWPVPSASVVTVVRVGSRRRGQEDEGRERGHDELGHLGGLAT